MEPEALVLLGAIAAKALLGSGFRVDAGARAAVGRATSRRSCRPRSTPRRFCALRDDAARERERKAFVEDLRTVARALAEPARSARERSATGWRKSGSGRTRPRPVSRSQICSSWARCSSMTSSMRRSRRCGWPRGSARGCRSPSRARAGRAAPCRARSRAAGTGCASATRRSSCRSPAPSPGGTSGRAGGRGPRAAASRRARPARAGARSSAACREVLVAGVDGGELGHARLEQPARLEHAGHLAHADLLTLLQELAGHELAAPRRCRRPGRGAPRARRPRPAP